MGDGKHQETGKHTSKTARRLLLCLFIVVLALRIFFAFQTDHFSGDEAYFTLRQVENIQDSFLPLYDDPLSFGGREHSFAPLFYYLVAGLTMVLPAWFVGKILINAAAASMVFIIYAITKKITQDEKPALFSALVGAFIPIYFSATTNTFSFSALVFPLLFLMVYLYLGIERRSSAKLFMLLFFIVSLMHYLSILFIVSWVLYLILIKIENLHATKEEVEVGIFSIFLFVWLHLLLYKNAFLSHGLGVIWQNVPDVILNTYFSDITLISALYFVGLIPLVYGVYAVFYHTFHTKNKKIYFLTAFTLATFLLLWLGFIQIELGLISLGIIMSILFSEFYLSLFQYINKTKFAQYKKLIWAFFFVVVFISSILPSLSATNDSIKDALSPEEHEAFTWLEKHTPLESVILATPSEGHLITYLSKRKNVLDSKFLGITDSNQRFEDASAVYTTSYETDAVKKLNRYDVSHIIISKRIKKQLKTQLEFVSDTDCFKPVFENKHVQVFKTVCTLK